MANTTAFGKLLGARRRRSYAGEFSGGADPGIGGQGTGAKAAKKTGVHKSPDLKKAAKSALTIDNTKKTKNGKPAAPKKKKIVRSVLQQQAKNAQDAKTKAKLQSKSYKSKEANVLSDVDAHLAKVNQADQDAAADAARSTATHKYQTIRGDYPTDMSKQPQ